jgi:flagellar assembly protein FliH
MAVIRSGSKIPESLFFSIKDVEDEAKQLVTSARVQADHVADAARTEGAEQGRREGYEAGLAQGQAEGREQALAEYREQLAVAAEALSRAQTEFASAQQEFQGLVLRDCVDLALAVARRITRLQAQCDPQVLMTNLEQAVKLVVGSRCFRIAFHPHDRAAMDSALEQLKVSYPSLENSRLIEDATLSRGGCRIYTETGLIDADIESQLDRLIEQIRPDMEKNA